MIVDVGGMNLETVSSWYRQKGLHRKPMFSMQSIFLLKYY
jgi:hypothetical protein